MPTRQIGTIIQIGSMSYGVILPKPWLTYFKLRKGEKVEIITDDAVMIRPFTSKNKKIKRDIREIEVD